MQSPFVTIGSRLLLAVDRRAPRKPGAGKQAMRSSRSRPTDAAHERPADAGNEITIRLSSPEDRVAILRLAELDGRRAPSGEAILAVVGGELRAALSLEGEDAVADPFWPTSELVELLRVRAGALRRAGAGGRRARLRRIGLAPRRWAPGP
jgi:hypothetical protein